MSTVVRIPASYDALYSRRTLPKRLRWMALARHGCASLLLIERLHSSVLIIQLLKEGRTPALWRDNDGSKETRRLPNVVMRSEARLGVTELRPLAPRYSRKRGRQNTQLLNYEEEQCAGVSGFPGERVLQFRRGHRVGGCVSW